MDESVASVPGRLLQELDMPLKAQFALARGLCPDCGGALEVVDTWERACSDAQCGYTFNYYDSRPPCGLP